MDTPKWPFYHKRCKHSTYIVNMFTCTKLTGQRRILAKPVMSDRKCLPHTMSLEVTDLGLWIRSWHFPCTFPRLLPVFKARKIMSRSMTRPTKWPVRIARLINLGGSAMASPQADQSPLSMWRRFGSFATHKVHSEDWSDWLKCSRGRVVNILTGSRGLRFESGWRRDSFQT